MGFQQKLGQIMEVKTCIEAWRMMMEEHGTDRCIIVGSSAPNECIERLQRDVHCMFCCSSLWQSLQSNGS